MISASAFGVVHLVTAPPAALAVFENASTPEDLAATRVLDEDGAPYLGEPRVLAVDGDMRIVGTRAPAGTDERLNQAYGYPSFLLTGATAADPGDPVPAESEICVWMIPADGSVRGRCAPPTVFASAGIAVADVEPARETIAFWLPDGSAGIESYAFGPASLDELRALDLPAITALERSVESRDVRAFDRVGSPDQTLVLPDRQLASLGGWQLTASVVQPEPGSGLLVCVEAVSEANADAVVTDCVDVPTFAAAGSRNRVLIEGTADQPDTTVAWSWTPSDDIIFEAGTL